MSFSRVFRAFVVCSLVAPTLVWAETMDIRKLGIAEPFPDPFPVVNAANDGNVNRVDSDDYFFYSTHSKKLEIDQNFFSTSELSELTLTTGIEYDVTYLESQINQNYLRVGENLWAKNVYYDPDHSCNWHMIAAAPLWIKDDAPSDINWPLKYKTVIVHLSPDYDEPGYGGGMRCEDQSANEAHDLTVREEFDAITSWTVDKVLVGNLGTAWEYSDFGNYAGKLYRDPPSVAGGDGDLYLIYVARLPDYRMGIRSQKMDKPMVAASDPPTDLLQSNRYLNSEYRNMEKTHQSVKNNASMQVLETGNVLKIGGTWVMLYTVGDYERENYKIGVAYLDPDPSSKSLESAFKKVFVNDNGNDVWGSDRGEKEVQYLIQSQKSGWPNYTTDVYAPGVPSIIRVGQDYYLFFAGNIEEDLDPETGKFDPKKRKVYYAPLDIDIRNADLAERIKIRRIN